MFILINGMFWNSVSYFLITVTVFFYCDYTFFNILLVCYASVSEFFWHRLTCFAANKGLVNRLFLSFCHGQMICFVVSKLNSKNSVIVKQALDVVLVVLHVYSKKNNVCRSVVTHQVFLCVVLFDELH